MPILAAFRGIIIRMHIGDHSPAHFHAEYQGENAAFTLDGKVLAGHLRSAAIRRLVREWANRHRHELAVNWRRAQRGESLERIAPLE